MRADSAKVGLHYAAGTGPFWADLAKEFDAQLAIHGLDSFEPYNVRFSAFPPGHKAYYEFAVFMLAHELREQDKWGVWDRLRATAASAKLPHTIDVDGVPISWDLAVSVQNLCAAGSADPRLFTDPVVLLDLGSGWGRIGHALLRINPAAAYLAVDIPESLLICQNGLPSTLEVNAYGYLEHKGDVKRARLLAEPGAHFIGAHMVPQIEDNVADMFVNVASFQEMTNEQVRAYLLDAGRVSRSFIYIQQLAKSHHRGGFQFAADTRYPVPSSWKEIFWRPCFHLPGQFEALYRIPEE